MPLESERSQYLQDEVLAQSLRNPEEFWARQANALFWHKRPQAALRTTQKITSDGRHLPAWQWFPGGEVSTCYNCVDRHVNAGGGSNIAIYYDSPVTKIKEQYTYARLLKEVETLAGALGDEGVERGDVVLLYMPMIPAALIAMLAINRLGAIHSVVFGGFASNALAQRIDACNPKLVLTASCGIVGNRPPIAYQSLVENAIQLASHKVQSVIVWQRDQLRWTSKSWWTRLWSWLKRIVLRRKVEAPRCVVWQDLVSKAKARKIRADCVPVSSDEPIYIMHTSGTTGVPKGVLRYAGGHAVGLSLSIGYIFGIHGPGDVSFTASDIGWVVGHSYILYAPLLAGASTVLYEGKPVGTPDASAFWRIIEEYKVSTMFTAPTALRAVRHEDPRGEMLSAIGRREGLRSLKALFLAGERSEPALVSHFQELLSNFGAPSCRVIDNWWSTESGSPITGRALAPYVALGSQAEVKDFAIPSLKPGSAGKAMPGFDIRSVDDDGNEVLRGSMGNLVLGLPLAPTAFHTLWQDEDRFYNSYLRRFDGRFLDTGDAGWIDEAGYVHVMGRNDDVLNVSAYRLSSGAIEQAISSHPRVTEACVVGIPDELKGQMPFAFIALSGGQDSTLVRPEPWLMAEIQQSVRQQVGAFASLGGIIQGNGMIPKTRSGKTLRRVLRQLLENQVHGLDAADVEIPSTIEDATVVQVAKRRVDEYFAVSKGKHKAIEVKSDSFDIV